jgi:small GTP-binding protein
LDKKYSISKKICMLGSFGVGKTSLVRRFVLNQFTEEYRSTMGVHIQKQPVSLTKDASSGINLILWDIAHIEEFNRVIKDYFRGSSGAVVVFDVTRPQSFQETDIYLKPFLELNPKSKFIFVGNKIDLVDKKSYNMEQLLQISKTYNSLSFLTSAKTSENVDELFHKLAALLVR